MGNAFLVNFILIFVCILVLILVGSLSYSKAYRTKNRIVNIIEKHCGYDESAREEIDILLSDIGYLVNPRGTTRCSQDKGQLLEPYATNYNYCVYKNLDAKGYYFTVVVFMYFEFPIIGDFVQFPVVGETYVIYNL